MPLEVVNPVRSTIVFGRYWRLVRASPVGRRLKWPASASSSAANTEGLSNRGRHSQSTLPSRLTSAAPCRSDSSP